MSFYKPTETVYYKDSNTECKSALIRELKYKFLSLAIREMKTYTKDLESKIIMSCIPLDNKSYLELNGQKLKQKLYPTLYKHFTNLFLADYNKNINGEEINATEDFVLPNCYDRALIMIEDAAKKDKLDVTRTIGDNKDWRINPDLLLSFNLSGQPTVLKNIEDIVDDDNSTNSYALSKAGSGVYVNKKLTIEALEPNQYSGVDELKIDAKLLFNSRRIFFYIKIPEYDKLFADVLNNPKYSSAPEAMLKL